jgi:muconolactone delta-isomerase
MLYFLDVDIDYGAMGERKAELLQAEHARVAELIRQGVVLCEWRKANGRGILAVWDCRSNEHLRELIASVPLAPYLSRVELVPLVDHPLFPGGLPRGPSATA